MSMTAKELFELDDFDPELEALDLITNFRCTVKLLDKIHKAVFDKKEQGRSVKNIYVEYLYELGLINTDDDLPSVLTGRPETINESQALRNLKYPMGVSTMAAYIGLNLGVAKEIVAKRITTKNTEKEKELWHLNEFQFVHGKSDPDPGVKKIVSRLRNAVSHHRFKLRIPDSRLHISDVRDRVEVTFYDSDGNLENDFYAKANFRSVEKLMDKLQETEYFFFNCPIFESDVYSREEIVGYVNKCFHHFTKLFSKDNLRFHGLKQSRFTDEPSCVFLSKPLSDCVEFEVCVSVEGEECPPQYIQIPFFSRSRSGSVLIESRYYTLGEYPVDWMLNHHASPLCRLDKKIRSIYKKSVDWAGAIARV